MLQIVFLQAAPDFKNLLLPVALFSILYFFFILPQRRKMKKEKSFRAEIKKGTKVVTTSGIHGRIVEINDKNNTVVIETGAGKIRFERAAISMELTQKQIEK
ncbi:preprotein translocase subunit YajC [Tenacibaculum sp. 190524A05c]|uniref:Sec translocon accessory complex subunit YajC n=1 Tax=Tenacibaculum platacis TaxID=3137852 RepID=A0ABM9P506_9FLAO